MFTSFSPVPNLTGHAFVWEYKVNCMLNRKPIDKSDPIAESQCTSVTVSELADKSCVSKHEGWSIRLGHIYIFSDVLKGHYWKEKLIRKVSFEAIT